MVFVSPKISMKTEFSELPARLDRSLASSLSLAKHHRFEPRPIRHFLHIILLRISQLSYLGHLLYTYIASGTAISI